MQERSDASELAVSELVTNALVHAGTDVHLHVSVGEAGMRVEVADGSPHQPVPRDYSSTSGTGRGLRLLEDAVDRWGTLPDGDGKVVWFEIRAHPYASRCGEASARPGQAGESRPTETGGAAGTVDVDLRNVPLLMHSAWQEHASAVLREYLLVLVEVDDPDIFERHAAASDAMNLLYEQIPAPVLDDDPEALMASAVEPWVSHERLVLAIPRASVAHFQTLDDMLQQAVSLADAQDLLVPPTQPEIRSMSTWLCAQVRGQSGEGQTGEAVAPVPWSSRSGIPQRAAVREDRNTDEVTGSVKALLATDEASLIVAVSPAALAFLGYDHAAELLGRRVTMIIPDRYHQAHIAGTTLHLTNGRSPLLGRQITVPVVLADDTERPAGLVVEPRRLPGGRRIFVAEFLTADDGPAGRD